MNLICYYIFLLFQVISLETGEALGPNERGEVCMKGHQTMLGNYLKYQNFTHLFFVFF